MAQKSLGDLEMTTCEHQKWYQEDTQMWQEDPINDHLSDMYHQIGPRNNKKHKTDRQSQKTVEPKLSEPCERYIFNSENKVVWILEGVIFLKLVLFLQRR